MENSKYLVLARQARAEDNSEDAKTYYNKVREEDPENGEAKFFYAYYSLYEGKVGEIPQRFVHVCQSVISACRMIKNKDAPLVEQCEATSEIVNAFVPLTWALHKYMNNKNRETKVGDSYVKIFDQSAISSSSKKGMFALRDLGDEIARIYNGDALAMTIAVSAWKEYVALAQKWYAYPPKGEAEAYAEKIKKLEPSYEIPKKAGCISLANTR